MAKKRLVVLGSTGSIGRNTIAVVKAFPQEFEVVALVARNNVELLVEQAIAVNAKFVVTTNEANLTKLKALLPNSVQAMAGASAMTMVSAMAEVDIVLCAVVGTAGFLPVLAALESDKTVALASKEILVMAGDLVTEKLQEHPNAKIVPVDSEHSAIFQCLQGRRSDEVSRLILTASGGAFRGMSRDELALVGWDDALKHPTWSMGEKVTIDSASLMNKALELVEAKYLFGVDAIKLEVVIHPQSIVHSMVELVDGSIIAQAAVPDMRFAIQYALSYPERWRGELPPLNRQSIYNLNFEWADESSHPALGFARRAMELGGTLPTVMNAANEVAVENFRKKKIAFLEIWSIIDKVMLAHQIVPQKSIEQIQQADAWARKFAQEVIDKKG